MNSGGEIHPDLMEMPGRDNSSGEIHPDLMEMSCRDDFQRRNSS